MNISSDITALNAQESGAIQGRQENHEIRQVCKDLEGVFVGILLKQGMKPALSDDDGTAGSGQMMDFAIEQTAAEIGSTSGFGIADMLYDQLTELF